MYPRLNPGEAGILEIPTDATKIPQGKLILVAKKLERYNLERHKTFQVITTSFQLNTRDQMAAPPQQNQMVILDFHSCQAVARWPNSRTSVVSEKTEWELSTQLGAESLPPLLWVESNGEQWGPAPLPPRQGSVSTCLVGVLNSHTAQQSHGAPHPWVSKEAHGNTQTSTLPDSNKVVPSPFTQHSNTKGSQIKHTT